MSNFCHLHVHNEFSLLDGVGTAEEYVKKAKELGFEHLALTNHGNIDGCIQFQEACQEFGIKPILGFEGYIVPDISIKQKGDTRRHIVLLAKNEAGWINICKMVTIANLDGFYYKPRISPEILLKHVEGVVVLTACASTFIQDEWGVDLLKELKKRTEVFIEIMPFDMSDQKATNLLAWALSDELDIPMVATNDCHYPAREENKLQEVLLAMQTGKRWSDPRRWKFDVTDLYLKTKTEMARSFEKQGVLPAEVYRRAIYNTAVVADISGDFLIPKRETNLPKVPVVGDQDPNKFFDRICRIGLQNKIVNNPNLAAPYKTYIDRYREEREVIIRQGFVPYFLIVWELVDWCKKNDIMVGPGRGSSGGSLICYLLGITAVDPIKYKLIFARFISPARIDYPDIDLDFEDKERIRIREHFEEIYGKYNVAGVSTFARMKGRGALRDVSRVFDVPVMDVNKASSSIVVRSGGDFRSDFTIEDAFNTFEDGIRFREKYPEVTDLAISVEGQVKSKGMHAAAIVISEEDLRTGLRSSLLYAKDKQIVVNWDKRDVEHVGLMKLDILGLNALTILNETRKLIESTRGDKIDFESLSLDDPKCYKEFSAGNNIGCFQVGSLGLRRLCAQLEIDDFQMLVHATSLHRPGTLRSGMTTEFCKRKRGEKTWDHQHPFLAEITKDTYGIILYQEQVMRFMYELGGLGWKTADTVRKVMSKSQGVEQFLRFKDMFVEGCLKNNTLDAETAEKLWDELASFGSYGFNLSHAVEYSVITYWGMWLKIYYPEEYLCCWLTHGPEDKKTEILEEAFRLGLRVELPKIGFSKAKTWTVKGNRLFMPFLTIKGVGEKTAKNLESTKESEKGFLSASGKKISAGILLTLTKIGALDPDKSFVEEEEEELSKYLSVSINRDPGKKYDKLMKKILGKIRISSIGDIPWKERADNKICYYFGVMTEVRFGYREKVSSLTTKDKMIAAGGFENLGGVYGNLKDKTDFVMLVFDQGIYQRKKDAVEHAGEKFLLAEAVRMHHNNLTCKEAWFQEDLVSGDLANLELGLRKSVSFCNEELLDCNLCELRKECSSPVLPSKGKYNAMIVGEAPGRDENLQGEGFVGSSGQLMWTTAGEFGLTRDMVHVSNIVKCYPSETKTPGKKHIKACSKWLDEEIKQVDPYVVLAFGNTGLQYFKGESSGIMALNGTTEWIDKANAWVCWCIHPASVLYHQENLVLFKAGVQNFCDKFVELGGDLVSSRRRR